MADFGLTPEPSRSATPVATDKPVMGQPVPVEAVAAVVPPTAVPQEGEWKDGCCNCGNDCCTCCAEIWCTPIAIAQLVTHTKSNCFGCGCVGLAFFLWFLIVVFTLVDAVASSAQEISVLPNCSETLGTPWSFLCNTAIGLTIGQAASGLTAVYSLVTLVLLCRARSRLRQSEQIPAKCCGGAHCCCEAACEDCCCLFWCSPCSICQMLRHVTPQRNYKLCAELPDANAMEDGLLASGGYVPYQP